MTPTAFALALAIGSIATACAAATRDDPIGALIERAQQSDHHAGSHHWKTGERIDRETWRSASFVAYGEHHLRAPPPGYEWRQADDQYVLAGASGGWIAAVSDAGGGF